MQGTSDPSRVELLDAAALCRHLVAEGSVYAFLADHRNQLFPDQLFADLFPPAVAGPRSIKPIPLRPATPDGFTRDDFAVDLQARTVTCPAGHTVTITLAAGRCSTGAVAPARCGPAAPPPGTARPSPCIPRRPNWQQRAAAPPTRPSSRLPALAADGGALDRLAGRQGHRRVRYRGLARNQLGLPLWVAAINLRRLTAMGLDHHDGGWVLA